MSVIKSGQGLFVVDDEKVKLAKKHLMNAKLRELRLRHIEEAVKAKAIRKRFRAPVDALNHLVEIGIANRAELDKILDEVDLEFKLTQTSARQVVKKQREANRRNVTKSRMRNDLFKKVMSLRLQKMLSSEECTVLLEKEKLLHFDKWMEFVQGCGPKAGRPTFWTYYTPVLLAEYKRLLEEKGYDSEAIIEGFATLVDGNP